MADQLQGLQKGQFFLTAVDLAAEQVFLSGEFQKHVAQFGKDREEQAKRAIADHRFDQINQENGEYNSLLLLGAQKQQIWRNLALEVLDSGNNLGFSALEALILKQSLLLAPIIDQMYFKWREVMLDSELGKKLKAMGPEKSAQYMEEQKATNAYTIPILEGEKVSEKPYAIFFAEETTELSQIFQDLINKLQTFLQDTQTKAFIAYFQALDQAFTETNPDQLEQKWKTVDEVWMDVKGDFQPIHPMESYVDPARLRVDLEFRVVIPDETAAALNATVKVTQTRLIRDLQKMYPDHKTLEQSIAPMESCKVLAGTTIVMSGWCLDFRSAGQNVPNREEVKLSHGVKIFLDTKSLELRGKLMKKMAAAIFGKEIIAKNYLDQDFLISAGIIVAGHEVAHNAFVTPESDPKIGKTLRSLVEETKATMSGVVILPEQLQKGELSQENMRAVVTVLVGESLRELVMAGKETVKPYYITGVSNFNLLMGAGVVSKTDKWSLDLSDAKVNQFLQDLKKAYDILVDAYENYQSAKVEQFFQTYFVENDQIKELIKLARTAENS